MPGDRFIGEKRNERIYILKKGPLEAYLPDGYRSKDIDKLIKLIADPDFWDKLDPDSRSELNAISALLMPAAPQL